MSLLILSLLLGLLAVQSAQAFNFKSYIPDEVQDLIRMATETYTEKPLVWKNCNEDELFNVTKVTIDPYPVKPGQDALITCIGTQRETVSGGNWTAYISYGHWKLQKMNGEVCGLSPDCECPCSDKVVTTVLKVPVTGIAPTARYTGKFTSTDQNGKSLGCIEYQFDIAR